MCYSSVFNYWDLLFFILGIFASVCTSLYVIKWFKPDICICIPKVESINFYDKDGKTKENESTVIKVPVKNLSKKYSAINLRTEICVVEGNFTYHFDLDRQDIIMISKKNSHYKSDERNYIGYKIAEFTRTRTGINTVEDLIKILINDDAYLRVRVHASHEFTGFGKAFEATFKYNKDCFSSMCQKNISLTRDTKK